MAMQSSSDNEKGQIFNEINITPLTDIFLVLLIIMMVMAPMFQAVDKDINIPEINSGINVEDDKVSIAVTKEAEFFVNGDPTNPENLVQVLTSLLDQTKEKTVVVKADEQTKSKEIMKIMRAAQAAGYEKLTVAGEPLTKQQQKELQAQPANIEMQEIQ